MDDKWTERALALLRKLVEVSDRIPAGVEDAMVNMAEMSEWTASARKLVDEVDDDDEDSDDEDSDDDDSDDEDSEEEIKLAHQRAVPIL